MRVMLALLCARLMMAPSLDAQTRKTTPKKAPAKTSGKAPAPVISRIQAEWRCPSELGQGVATGRRFCDVLTGRDPKEGIWNFIDESIGSGTDAHVNLARAGGPSGKPGRPS